MALFAIAHKKKNINDQLAELGHPSEVITHAMIKLMNIKVADTFKPCGDCAFEKAKKLESEKSLLLLKILDERLFFDISLHSTPTFECKNIGYLP